MEWDPPFVSSLMDAHDGQVIKFNFGVARVLKIFYTQ